MDAIVPTHSGYKKRTCVKLSTGPECVKSDATLDKRGGVVYCYLKVISMKGNRGGTEVNGLGFR